MAAGQESSAKVEGSGKEIENQFPLHHAVHRHVDIVAGSGRMEPACQIVAARVGRSRKRVAKQKADRNCFCVT